MALLSIEEVSQELSVSVDLIRRLIENRIIIPYGGKARLGEPRFAQTMLPSLREKIEHYQLKV